MGQFIDEVAKNNRLQREFLTEKQQKQAEKEQKQKERYNESQYKQILQQIKKECLNTLYLDILQLYKDFGSITYNVYNNYDKMQEIIANIIDNNKLITMLLNKEDIEQIKIELQKKYFTLLKKQYNIQQNIEKSQIELLPDSNEDEQECKKNNSIIYYIFGWIFAFVYTFLKQLSRLRSCSRYKKKKKVLENAFFFCCFFIKYLH